MWNRVTSIRVWRLWVGVGLTIVAVCIVIGAFNVATGNYLWAAIDAACAALNGEAAWRWVRMIRERRDYEAWVSHRYGRYLARR
jgi:hypothetical protein